MITSLKSCGYFSDGFSLRYKNLFYNHLTQGAVNKKWEIYETEFLSILENYDINEESRTVLIKQTLNQLVRNLNSVYATLNASQFNLKTLEEKYSELSDTSKKKNYQLVKQFNKLKTQTGMPHIHREEFISFEEFKQSQRTETEDESSVGATINLDAIEEKSTLDQLYHFVMKREGLERAKRFFGEAKVVLNKANPVLKNRELPMNSAFLRALFNNRANIKYFIDRFTPEIEDLTYIEVDLDGFFELVEIMNIVISKLATISDKKKAELFHGLLMIATRIFVQSHEREQKRQCLNKYIVEGNRDFWEDSEWWFLLMQWQLERKSFRSNFLTGGYILLKKLRSMETSSLDNEYKTKCLEVVDEINFNLINLGLRIEFSTEIMIALCRQYEIDKEDIKFLLETQERKNSSDTRINYKLLCGRNHIKGLKTQRKYGTRYFVIASALPFLTNGDFLNVLCIRKEWKAPMEKAVYHAVLNRPDGALPLKMRLQIWMKILGTDKLQIDYIELKTFFTLEGKLPPGIEDLIALDVQRSFHNHKHINQLVMNSLLKVYAHYNPRVCYCQGMNYIMGFLLIHFLDEMATFKFFVTFIEKRMSGLLTDNLEKLKLHFYILDRLTEIFVPNLYDHMQKMQIDSCLFASPWLITLFTNSFQYTEFSYILMRIWDNFLLNGWKAVYKVIIYVLRINESKMLKMKFDETIKTLHDLGKDEFFTNTSYRKELEQSKKVSGMKDATSTNLTPVLKTEYQNILRFQEEINKIYIPGKLIEILETEYQNYRLKIDRIFNRSTTTSTQDSRTRDCPLSLHQKTLYSLFLIFLYVGLFCWGHAHQNLTVNMVTQ
eukprot:TRINITY_DN3309_c0_g1_i1.p1 TRINITY_DN3309_c0_g1~~TRINITY_DN3309_c0_g1_i1.p1  ORF type:complete len:834 (+),score=163.41 TRINITY_DN3309_c0_g1_i1:142-2643(+)